MTTWTVGQLVTAALMNSNIQALGNFVLAPPLVCTFASLAQSIPTGANTAIQLDTNVLDSDSGHSTTLNTSRYVFQQPGTFLAFGQVAFSPSATAGARGAALAKNGTVLNYIQPQIPAAAGAYTTTVPFVGFVSGNAGDYVEVLAYQGTGAALNTQAGWSSLNLLRVSN